MTNEFYAQKLLCGRYQTFNVRQTLEICDFLPFFAKQPINVSKSRSAKYLKFNT